MEKYYGKKRFVFNGIYRSEFGAYHPPNLGSPFNPATPRTDRKYYYNFARSRRGTTVYNNIIMVTGG